MEEHLMQCLELGVSGIFDYISFISHSYHGSSRFVTYPIPLHTVIAILVIREDFTEM
jgi:hypothetical protein